MSEYFSDGLGAACVANAGCAAAADCPSGSQWIATRSVPEGGMCVTPEAYANFVGGTVAKNLNVPWRTRYVAAPSFWDEHSTAVLVGGGVTVAVIGLLAYFAFRTKKTTSTTNRRRNRRPRRLQKGFSR